MPAPYFNHEKGRVLIFINLSGTFLILNRVAG